MKNDPFQSADGRRVAESWSRRPHVPTSSSPLLGQSFQRLDLQPQVTDAESSWISWIISASHAAHGRKEEAADSTWPVELHNTGRVRKVRGHASSRRLRRGRSRKEGRKVGR